MIKRRYPRFLIHVNIENVFVFVTKINPTRLMKRFAVYEFTFTRFVVKILLLNVLNKMLLLLQGQNKSLKTDSYLSYA